MAGNISREPMLDMFLFETGQLIEQLEQAILENEKEGCFSSDSINEIFRIMHTIKGSSAMMLYNGISKLAHSMEDVFYFIREKKPEYIDFKSLFDLVFKAVDFIKNEVVGIEANSSAITDSGVLVEEIKEFLSVMKSGNNILQTSENGESVRQTKKQRYYIGSNIATPTGSINLYKARITFEPDCEMENIRAFSIIHNLKDTAEVIGYEPSNIVDSEESAEIIRNEGFEVVFATEMSVEEAREALDKTVFLKELELTQIEDVGKPKKNIVLEDVTAENPKEISKSDMNPATVNAAKQNFISVNIQKLDMLMDLVGELVISEAMVTRNPEVTKLSIESFQKASRQHRKIISELQDMVMSVRMVPLSATFQKMNRIVRDMSKKLDKEVQLEIIGEATEVDKNIIESISDPLMHLIRNAIDHGLEKTDERKKKGKCQTGKIILEARNAGGEVIISIKDDGRGLDKSGIYEKAVTHGLTSKAESELTEKEVFSFIFLPGFSMKENVTEFSGRGVGMDVVMKNIEKVGGAVEIESKKDEGTAIHLKIPLTLAIIDGMLVTVGKASYIIPNVVIKESFRPKEEELITDPDGNEMLVIRGKSFTVLRLHRQFGIKTEVIAIHEGIVLMIEDENGSACLFADALIGEQQVVVKALPSYMKKVNGLAGCTLLGDGSISLILDTGALIKNKKER